MMDQGYDSFLEPKKESKKAACDAKVKLIKLEGGTAAPRGREKLESLGLEQAPPARFCLFPLWSGFASPALICDQRATGRNWVRELDLADCDRCEEKPSFLKIARQKKPSP